MYVLRDTGTIQTDWHIVITLIMQYNYWFRFGMYVLHKSYTDSVQMESVFSSLSEGGGIQ